MAPSIHTNGTVGNCVVLLSGGIDSAACVDFYQRQQFNISAMHFSYGQPAAVQEKHAARLLASYFQIPLTVIQMAGARSKTDGEIIGRNAFLLFAALEELQTPSGLVVLGIHSGTAYYDCSSNFLSTAQAIVDGQCSGRIRFVAPFLEWSKKEIWEYCLQHRVPVELTYSCEKGLSQPCGQCISCRDLEVLGAR